MEEKTLQEIQAEVEELKKGIAQLQKDADELQKMTLQYIALEKRRRKNQSACDLYSLRLMHLIEKNGKHR